MKNKIIYAMSQEYFTEMDDYQSDTRDTIKIVAPERYTDFIDFATLDPHIEFSMEEIPVLPNSKLADVTLVDSGIRKELDLIIVAIKKGDGEMFFNPAYHTRIQIGDTLIALGQRDSLVELEKLLRGTTQ